MKKIYLYFLAIVITFFLGLAGFLAYQNYFLKKQPPELKKITPTPSKISPTPTSKPLATPTKASEEPKFGTVTGRLCYPSQFLPKGVIEAKNVTTSEIFKQDYPGTEFGGGTSYSFKLKPGKYKLRYKAQMYADQPDKFLSSYYTLCSIDPTKCAYEDQRSSIVVEVIADKTINNIDLCDSYHTDQTEPDF